MIVKDLMTKQPATVSMDDALATAAQKMWDGDCGALPVLRSDGTVAGMITDRDICMATWSRGLAPSAICVAEAMSTDLVSCSPEDTIAAVEGALRSNQLRRLPVLDAAGRLVGILSLADIARASQHIDGKAVAKTLAGICERAPGSPAASASAAAS